MACDRPFEWNRNNSIFAEKQSWAQPVSPDWTIFCKFLATNCLAKVVQIFWWLFGLFLIMSLLFKKWVATFWAIWGEIRQFLNPASGHIAHSNEPKQLSLCKLNPCYFYECTAILFCPNEENSLNEILFTFSRFKSWIRNEISQKSFWKHLRLLMLLLMTSSSKQLQIFSLRNDSVDIVSTLQLSFHFHPLLIRS